MKKIYRNFIMAFGVAASLTSCTKFLDLKPEGQLLEEDVFSSAKNVTAYLNGIYVKMGTAQLYGDNLTLSVIDLFAQRYNLGPTHSYYVFGQQRYTDARVATRVAEIWNNSYNSIFNVNRFLANLDKASGVLDAKLDSTSRGEAYAIRAMLHFDVLRLFGPMYNSADSTLSSIPYNTSSEIVINPYLPANEVMSKVVADLKKAERLLSGDKTMNFDKKYRFTYYSVKALQARVNMYRGDKPAALAAAKVFIPTDQFRWVSSTVDLKDKTNIDKIFSSEIILGIYVPDLYASSGGQAKYFSSNLKDNDILAPHDGRLVAMFPETGDYRYLEQIWGKPATKNYKTFLKYDDVEDKGRPFRNTIPLLKLSEMYYIAAECEPDPAVGVTYLTEVRYSRNLSNTPVNVAELRNELTKEYQKDFFGEGQLFFYYKRNNFTSIPSGSSATGNYSMGSAATLRIKYVAPIPTDDLNPRK